MPGPVSFTDANKLRAYIARLDLIAFLGLGNGGHADRLYRFPITYSTRTYYCSNGLVVVSDETHDYSILCRAVLSNKLSYLLRRFLRVL